MNETTKRDDGTGAAIPDERMVIWRNTADHPLCADVEPETGCFEVLIDAPFIAEIPILASPLSDRHGDEHCEYYIVSIGNSGELEDMGRNGIGLDWESVARWVPLDEVIGK